MSRSKNHRAARKQPNNHRRSTSNRLERLGVSLPGRRGTRRAIGNKQRKSAVGRPMRAGAAPRRSGMRVTISWLAMKYAAHTQRQVIVPIPWMPRG